MVHVLPGHPVNPGLRNRLDLSQRSPGVIRQLAVLEQFNDIAVSGYQRQRIHFADKHSMPFRQELFFKLLFLVRAASAAHDCLYQRLQRCAHDERRRRFPHVQFPAFAAKVPYRVCQHVQAQRRFCHEACHRLDRVIRASHVLALNHQRIIHLRLAHHFVEPLRDFLHKFVALCVHALVQRRLFQLAGNPHSAPCQRVHLLRQDRCHFRRRPARFPRLADLFFRRNVVDHALALVHVKPAHILDHGHAAVFQHFIMDLSPMRRTQRPRQIYRVNLHRRPDIAQRLLRRHA